MQKNNQKTKLNEWIEAIGATVCIFGGLYLFVVTAPTWGPKLEASVNRLGAMIDAYANAPPKCTYRVVGNELFRC